MTPEELHAWDVAETKAITSLYALRHHAPYRGDAEYRKRVDAAIKAAERVSDHAEGRLEGMGG